MAWLFRDIALKYRALLTNYDQRVQTEGLLVLKPCLDPELSEGTPRTPSSTPRRKSALHGRGSIPGENPSPK